LIGLDTANTKPYDAVELGAAVADDAVRQPFYKLSNGTRIHDSCLDSRRIRAVQGERSVPLLARLMVPAWSREHGQCRLASLLILLPDLTDANVWDPAVNEAVRNRIELFFEDLERLCGVRNLARYCKIERCAGRDGIAHVHILVPWWVAELYRVHAENSAMVDLPGLRLDHRRVWSVDGAQVMQTWVYLRKCCDGEALRYREDRRTLDEQERGTVHALERRAEALLVNAGLNRRRLRSATWSRHLPRLTIPLTRWAREAVLAMARGTTPAMPGLSWETAIRCLALQFRRYAATLRRRTERPGPRRSAGSVLSIPAPVQAPSAHPSRGRHGMARARAPPCPTSALHPCSRCPEENTCPSSVRRPVSDEVSPCSSSVHAGARPHLPGQPGGCFCCRASARQGEARHRPCSGSSAGTTRTGTTAPIGSASSWGRRCSDGAQFRWGLTVPAAATVSRAEKSSINSPPWKVARMVTRYQKSRAAAPQYIMRELYHLPTEAPGLVKRRPALYLTIKLRRDGVLQGYHERSVTTDPFPRRKTAIPPDPNVPKSQSLRGSPEKIVQRVMMDLHQRFPPPQARHARLIESPEAAPLRDRADLQRLIRSWGVNINSPLDLENLATGYAVHHRGTREIAILRACVDDLEAQDWPSRAKGVYAITHEYWHTLRVTASSIQPDAFEEGSADVFGVLQTQHLTGYRVVSPVLAYPAYAAGVLRIAHTVSSSGVLPWLLQSRQQADLPGWLEHELTTSGHPLDIARRIAHNAYRPADWLAAVQTLRR